MAKDNRITFRPGKVAEDYIAAHESGPRQTSGIINGAIDRLQYLLKTAEPDLTDAEWTLIYNVQSSAAPMPPAQTASGIVASIEDSILMDHMDDEYGVDGPALLAKIRNLDRTGRLAVVDRAERWWAEQD